MMNETFSRLLFGIIKRGLTILFVCMPVLSFGQSLDALNVQKIKLNESKFTLLVLKKGSVIYTGNFDTHHGSPVGTHYLYSKGGKLLKMMEYQFSEHKFEGVRNIIQTTYKFNSRQHLVAIQSAERCTECEFGPVGIWEYYNDKGEVIKTVDTALKVNEKLQHPAYEDYWQYINLVNQ